MFVSVSFVTLRNCASSSVPWYTGAPAGLLTSADSLACTKKRERPHEIRLRSRRIEATDT